MAHKKSIWIILALVIVNVTQGFTQFSIDIEGNYVVSILYNTVRIPSKGGTEIDLSKDLDPSNTFTYRARVNYTINKRHIISALAAPLTIKSTGSVNETLRYSDKLFEPNTKINATYKFNSYRLTYRYLFVFKDNLKFGAGITGKIREANITLEDESGSADFPNVGFVPLINFYFHWQPDTTWGLLVEGDALGTRQGRAEDIFASITYHFTPSIQLKGGYRILEGGADVTDNYNFTFVNYAALGATIKLQRQQ